MQSKAPTGCTSPKTGRYLDDFLAESEERRNIAERMRFFDHTKACPACRDAMLAAVNRTVLMPMIRKLARRYRLSPAAVLGQLLEFMSKGRAGRKRADQG